MDQIPVLTELQERRFRMERILHDVANPVAILQANIEFLLVVSMEEGLSEEVLGSIQDMHGCLPLLVDSLQSLRAYNQEKIAGE